MASGPGNFREILAHKHPKHNNGLDTCDSVHTHAPCRSRSMLIFFLKRPCKEGPLLGVS